MDVGQNAVVVVADDDATGGGHLVADAGEVSAQTLMGVGAVGAGSVSVVVTDARWQQIMSAMAGVHSLDIAGVMIDLVQSGETDTVRGRAATISGIADGGSDVRFSTHGYVRVRHGERHDGPWSDRAALIVGRRRWKSDAVVVSRLGSRRYPGEPARGSELREIAGDLGCDVCVVDDDVLTAADDDVVGTAVHVRLPLPHGEFRGIGFTLGADRAEHLALLACGARADNAGPMRVVVHLECPMADTFGALGCDCRDRLDAALISTIAGDTDVVLYLRDADWRSLAHTVRPIWNPDQVSSILRQLGVSGEHGTVITEPISPPACRSA